MQVTQVPARAKLNLTLDVLRKREDGYHDLQMIMQSVTLCDSVTLEMDGGGDGLTVQTNLGFLPADERNLAARAALRFREETGKGWRSLAIRIEKRIPVCAGLGGGSSDAAAVLRALNQMTGAGLSTLELAAIGERVGSDVPYCVLGTTALAEGRGERLTPLPPLPQCSIVLCKPRFSVSTPQLFSRISCHKLRHRPDTQGMIKALEAGDLPGVARRLYNVFEDVLPRRYAAQVAQLRHALLGHGALGAAMSGTGSTVFGLFDNAALAQEACQALSQHDCQVFLTSPVAGGEVIYPPAFS